jgi:hypothetical protein
MSRPPTTAFAMPDEDEPGYWVWVFGEIAALRWVVEHRQMPFAGHQQRRLAAMRAGDRAVLYTTRGAFHNPTRDQARLVGLVTVDASPSQADQPVAFGDREFTWACPIRIELLLPERTGASVRALVPDLDLVKKPHAWSSYFRQSPIRIGQDDFERMSAALGTVSTT